MGSHRRGPWSQAEDSYLLRLVQSQGAHNWVRISHLIASRSPKQCRERFHQNLKPSLNHDPITPEEGILIERLVGEMGKRWAEIARRLRGRSDNAVKNWWNGGMNRRRRLVVRSEGTNRSGKDFDEKIESLSFARPVRTAERSVGSIMIPPPRRPIEAPLTSPTTSEVSVADSVGEAPSLMSDTSSNVSTSPNVARMSSIELPPLIGTRAETRRPSLVLHLGSNDFVPNYDGLSPRCVDRHTPSSTIQHSLYQLAELATSASPAEHRQDRTSFPSQESVNLPSFQSLTCMPHAADARDTRMRMSALLC
ncbi:hypothetical protein MMC12_004069 [Toensbergia leucococca]|nr:hypothetical protein [Toensbergia leucococca]